MFKNTMQTGWLDLAVCQSYEAQRFAELEEKLKEMEECRSLCARGTALYEKLKSCLTEKSQQLLLFEYYSVLSSFFNLQKQHFYHQGAIDMLKRKAVLRKSEKAGGVQR